MKLKFSNKLFITSLLLVGGATSVIALSSCGSNSSAPASFEYLGSYAISSSTDENGKESYSARLLSDVDFFNTETNTFTYELNSQPDPYVLFKLSSKIKFSIELKYDFSNEQSPIIYTSGTESIPYFVYENDADKLKNDTITDIISMSPFADAAIYIGGNYFVKSFNNSQLDIDNSDNIIPTISEGEITSAMQEHKTVSAKAETSSSYYLMPIAKSLNTDNLENLENFSTYFGLVDMKMNSKQIIADGNPDISIKPNFKTNKNTKYTFNITPSSN